MESYCITLLLDRKIVTAQNTNAARIDTHKERAHMAAQTPLKSVTICMNKWFKTENPFLKSTVGKLVCYLNVFFVSLARSYSCLVSLLLLYEI